MAGSRERGWPARDGRRAIALNDSPIREGVQNVARRVVVINDDTTFLNLMRDLLSEEGYDVRSFNEGADAYEHVRDFDPAGIILDIRMERPETGWKVLELFKLDPHLSKKPIIVCSADLPSLQERAAYLKTKGCEILAKPFDLDDLLGLLRQLISGPEGEEK